MPSYMKVCNAADVKLITVSFIVCSKLPCVSHLNVKYWNSLNRELKLKLANTIVGPFSFDYKGNWYFELATATLHNSGAGIYWRIDWPARTPVILLTLLLPFVALFFGCYCICCWIRTERFVLCYVMLCYVMLLVLLLLFRHAVFCGVWGCY
jgi:hypothetical protein